MLFPFGLATLFYPPLELLMDSATTSKAIYTADWHWIYCHQ